MRGGGLMKAFFRAAVFCGLLVFSCADAMAQEAGEAFRVDGFSVHADAPKAEACFSFSSPLKSVGVGTALASLSVRKNGKKSKLSPQQISVAARALCVQGLDHGASYHIAVRGLVSEDGHLLSATAPKTFTVPTRRPVLAFMNEPDAPLLPRFSRIDDATPVPVLRSINVSTARLSLYRFQGAGALALAWPHIRQMPLAPSESLVFAREKGRLIFESDLVFGDKKNQEQTLASPLPRRETLSPGLYYLAAVPHGSKKDNPAFFAGQWFLVSSVRMGAVQRGDAGVHLFVADGAPLQPAKGAQVEQWSLREGKAVATIRTDDHGVAVFPLETGAKSGDDRIFIATNPDGALAVEEMGAREKNPTLARAKGHITADRQKYEGGQTAVVALWNPSLPPAAAGGREMSVRVLSSDGKEQGKGKALPLGHGTRLFVASVPLPKVDGAGEWTLSWESSDGGVWAQKKVTIVPVAGNEQISLKPLFAAEETGEQTVGLQVRNAAGEPLSFRSGAVSVAPAPIKIKGFEPYRFGLFSSDAAPAPFVTPFVTDAQGNAAVALPKDTWTRDFPVAASVKAVTDKGVASNVETLLPRRKDILIGVRALAHESLFVEGGTARFGVVAVSHDDQKVGREALRYIVYEEGRSFDWFQSEGRWDYKPLPWHRRVGGGVFDLTSGGEAVIKTPVASGHYILDITDDDGVVLARHPFTAARREEKGAVDGGSPVRLRLGEKMNGSGDGKSVEVPIFLEAPAFVFVMLDDGARAQTFWRQMPAGRQKVEVPLAPDGGRDRAVYALAFFAEGEEERATKIFDSPMADELLPIKMSVAPPSSGKTEGMVQITIGAGRKSVAAARAVALLEQGGEEALRLFQPANVDPKGSASLPFTPPPEGQKVRVAVVAWTQEEIFGVATQVIDRPLPASLEGDVPPSLLKGDRAVLSFSFKGATKGKGASYALVLPQALSSTEPLKGKIKGDGTITLRVTARETMREAQDVRLSVTDAKGRVHVKSWPLLIMGSESGTTKGEPLRLDISQELGKKESGERILLAPVPSPDVVPSLFRLMSMLPQTTEAVALWLEAMRLWREQVTGLGLMTPDAIDAVSSRRLRTLLNRQNPDGGFPLNAQGASDLQATSFAVMALSAAYPKERDSALSFLSARLENTWFNESERAARALAFAALARHGRAQTAALHYFCETSQDKILSAEPMAALAAALSLNGEDGKAQDWTLRAERDVFSWGAIRFLTSLRVHAKGDRQNGLMEGFAPPDISAPFVQTLSFLIAAAESALRAGSWHIKTKHGDRKKFGFYALAPDDWDDGQGVKNIGPKPLFGLRLAAAAPAGEKKTAAPSRVLGVTRALYTAEGVPVEDGAVLDVGKTYVLLVRVPRANAARQEEDLMRIVQPSGAGYHLALAPTLAPAALRIAMPWLPSSPLPVEEGVADGEGAGGVVAIGHESLMVMLLTPVRHGRYALPRGWGEDSSGVVPFAPDGKAFTVGE